MCKYRRYSRRMTRRAQSPITIRSDRARARLALHTRNGRSQARVIEEALDHLPLDEAEPSDLEVRRAAIMEILERIDVSGIPTMAEFDRMEYDENGDLR